MSTDKSAFDNLDDLLDADLDDLDDLPPLGAPPTGAYDMTVTMEMRTVPIKGVEKEVLIADFIVIEMKQVKNEAELLNEDGTAINLEGMKFGQMFNTDTAVGVGYLKAFLKPFREHFEVNKIRELIPMIKDVRIFGVVKRTMDKNDPEKTYGKVSRVVVL